MRGKGVVWAAVAVLVVGLVGAGLWWRHLQQEAERDRVAAAAFSAVARAWAAKDLAKAPLADPAAAAAFRRAVSGMGTSTATATSREVRRDGNRATARLSVTWTVAEGITWTYQVPLTATATATAVNDGWRVDTPANGSFAHPKLKATDTMRAAHVFAPRADLLDRNGQPLMPLGAVYPVQLDPTRATEDTARQLERLVNETPGTLVKKLAAAKKANSAAPIPVITYRESDFQQRQAELDALKGVIYPKREQPRARTRTFGQPLLGFYGPVTAESVKASKERYAAGDFAGLSGLQGQYDALLAGT